jgi:hypothetical protein
LAWLLAQASVSRASGAFLKSFYPEISTPRLPFKFEPKILSISSILAFKLQLEPWLQMAF